MDKKKTYDYRNNYNREHYARLSIQVPKEEKPKIEKHYKEKGFKSFNEYVTFLIKKDMY